MTDERITAYLLGELPDEESERFEEECFASNNWPDQIGPAENDLIDAYLRRELTPEQHQHFELNYLSTKARRERVAAAVALLAHVDSLGPQEAPAPPVEPNLIKRLIDFWGGQSWALRAGLAVGVVAVVASAIWLALPRTSSPQSVATLTLTISTTNRRDEGVRAERVKLPPGVRALRILLKLPEGATPAARYRVELLNDEGDAAPVKLSGQDAGSLSVEIPAEQLARGQYALELFIVNPAGTEQRVSGSYFFIVE